jgi:RND family efflux transporter MFP subunit
MLPALRLLLATSTILLAACDVETPRPEPRLVVPAYEVGRAVVKGERTFHGRVVPADLTKVAFRIPGKIADLPTQPGQRVFAGQVLARLEDSIQQQVLADARAQYRLAERQLERAESLHRRGSLTAAQRDQLQAGYRLAEANLRLAEASLSYTLVKAPFDGTVADVFKEHYESVAVGEPVVTVYRSSRVDVLIDIPDILPARVHQARDVFSLEAEAVFSGNPKTYSMRLLKGSTARDPKTQAFKIWFTMPAQEMALSPGLPVTVSVDLNEAGFTTDTGLVVPLTALEAGSDADEFHVWLYRNGVVKPTPVQVGRITQEGVLILNGLQQGDTIVNGSFSRLTPGMEVDIEIPGQGS